MHGLCSPFKLSHKHRKLGMVRVADCCARDLVQFLVKSVHFLNILFCCIYLIRRASWKISFVWSQQTATIYGLKCSGPFTLDDDDRFLTIYLSSGIGAAPFSDDKNKWVSSVNGLLMNQQSSSSSQTLTKATIPYQTSVYKWNIHWWSSVIVECESFSWFEAIVLHRTVFHWPIRRSDPAVTAVCRWKQDVRTV